MHDRYLQEMRDNSALSIDPQYLEISMAIKIKEETAQSLIRSIQRYFSENMEESIGDLKAKLLLDFCVKEIDPSIYNQAIQDAQSHLQDKVAEMDGDCYEAEHVYWRK